MVERSLIGRWLREPDPRLLRRFLVSGALRSARALGRWRRRARAGRPSTPPFLFISLTNDCNFSCQGCWVTPTRPPRELPPDALDRLIEEWRTAGASLFGLLGGEPLMYPGFWEILERHPAAYFQVFTNGWKLDDEAAAQFRRLGNASPLISIEGLAETADDRRGARGVAERAWAAVEACRRHRLITGVATSLCRSNVEAFANEAFLDDLIRRGVLYVWYYLYRPVGPRPAPELALEADAIARVRRFLMEARRRKPILIIDSYWDTDGRAICPAAMGVSHHVGPGGDIEPCPVVQFARDSIGDGRGVPQRIAGSSFLAAARRRLAAAGGGCILLRDPAGLLDFVTAAGAVDSSGRGTARDELRGMLPRPDHRTDPPIPERHWLYRRIKRSLFFGMGAYG